MRIVILLAFLSYCLEFFEYCYIFYGNLLNFKAPIGAKEWNWRELNPRLESFWQGIYKLIWD
jgi:hypothetical protein